MGTDQLIGLRACILTHLFNKYVDFSWDTYLINMWILADKACCFTNFSSIMS